MANEIDIVVKAAFTGEGAFDAANTKIADLNKNVEASGAAAEKSKGGWEGLSTAVGTFVGSMAAQLASQLPDIAVKLYDMGEESLRAKESFEALGGSTATIEKMQAAAHGLVDDTALLSNATELMSEHILSSQSDMEQLARIGATLGITFKGDATTGVELFTKSLESVGNVRGLRQLGIDTAAVKAEFDKLKDKMSDSEAWSKAVFDVAGETADKFAGKLDGAGTAVDRLHTRFEDAKEALGEWVATGVDKAATSLEKLEGIWDALHTNPSLVLSIAFKEMFQEASQAHNMGTTDPLTGKTYAEEAAAGSNINRTESGGRGFHGGTDTPDTEPIRREGRHVSGGATFTVNPFWGLRSSDGNEALHSLQRNGELQKNDVYMDSILNANMPGSDIMQRRARADSVTRDWRWEQASDSLRNEFVKPVEQAHDVEMAKSAWKDISGFVDGYTSKLKSGVDSLLAQQAAINEIVAKRDSIQSVGDAFGLKSDGLYGEIGSDMGEGIADARSKKESDLEDIGRRYGKNSKKYKAAQQDLEDFDSGSKDAMDEYAIATGSATRESIKFRDQMDASKQAFADGKISLEQYKNEMILMGEAAKQGATSMDQLTQIQARMNFAMRPGTKTDADKSQFDEHAGGVKGTGSYLGHGIDSPVKPFDDLFAAADKVTKATNTLSTQSSAAMSSLASAIQAPVNTMSGLTSGSHQALEAILNLKTELKSLSSFSVIVNKTSGGGGTGTQRTGGFR